MDYDDSYEQAMSSSCCTSCKDYDKSKNTLEEEVTYLMDLLYGELPFSAGNIEDALDTICHELGMKCRNGELQIEKKKKPLPAYLQNILNYQKELLDQG